MIIKLSLPPRPCGHIYEGGELANLAGKKN